MQLLSVAIENYVREHSISETLLLSELRRETYLKVLMPRMLSGPVQGSVLAMLVRMVRPQRILEIGTFTGYSAIWMASAMPSGSKLITLDINEELSEMVQKYIRRAKLQDVIETKIGHALEIIPTLEEPFDLVFIDADKINYLNYYELALEKLSSGGFIIADNVLWHGKVVDSGKKADAKTQVLKDFNAFVQQDSRVENVLLPIRDGLMVAQKK
ncbi:O-methyltransferase [Tunicatimonas pelagia]|uniref:O-methyltransferase n=1 Tax=Tunicatimonas pelagia TaxID=931531 RepID=UPI002666C610|nr:O-methyltransferase [Tunicatimonas pelagia]WKN45844.1 O-methyltransferase [Tunicatimonas pelagia]